MDRRQIGAAEVPLSIKNGTGTDLPICQGVLMPGTVVESKGLESLTLSG